MLQSLDEYSTSEEGLIYPSHFGLRSVLALCKVSVTLGEQLELGIN